MSHCWHKQSPEEARQLQQSPGGSQTSILAQKAALFDTGFKYYNPPQRPGLATALLFAFCLFSATQILML